MALKVLEVPLSPKPQTFAIQLAGVSYNMTFRFNSMMDCWVLDLMDASKAPVVSGIPVVTGLDLLAPYRYLGVGGALIAQTVNDPTAVPTFDNLGKTGKVYFVVRP